MKVIPTLLTALLFACQPTDLPRIETRADGTTAFDGNAMTMQYKVLVGQKLDSAQTAKISQIVNSTFDITDSIFNKWNPHSELSKLNSAKAGIAIQLSDNLFRLFKETDAIVKLSQGKFDPTIEPLQTLWKQKLQIGKVPGAVEIQAIAPTIGWDKISFSEGIFTKKHDQTKLDFGGIAKGLCIDMLFERLNGEGFSDFYVEWGGEIRTCGRHPEGRLWTVYISRLGDTSAENAITTLQLKDQAIATSGDYLQNWTVRLSDQEGRERSVTYFHIFDPKTLQPIEASYTSVASASVVAPSCALADGLATIPMMFGSSAEAAAWAESIKEHVPEATFWIISRSEISSTRSN